MRKLRGLTVVSTLVMIILSAITNLWTNLFPLAPHHRTLATAVLVTLALLALALSYRLTPAEKAEGSVSVNLTLAEARSRLRRTALSQWQSDLTFVQLAGSPLKIRWVREIRVFDASETMPSRIAESGPKAVSGSLAPAESPTDPSFSTILTWPPERGIEELRRQCFGLPNSRLLLVGPPGSGKTSAATLLLREIFESSPDDRVPVLFPLSDWNVERESLTQWMARHLNEKYTAFEGVDDSAEYSARGFVEQRGILPILDGLDELPWWATQRAVRIIGQSMDVDDPFVLTCRTEVYYQLLEAVPYELEVDNVIHLVPVDITDAFAFMKSGSTPTTYQQWNTLERRVSRAVDKQEIASALQVPLYAWLSRRVVASNILRPLDLERFATPAELKRALIRYAIPALVGRLESRKRVGLAPSRFHRFTEDKVRYYLAMVAVTAHNNGGSEFGWTDLWKSLSWTERRRVTAFVYRAYYGSMLAVLVGLYSTYGHSLTSLLTVASMGVLYIYAGSRHAMWRAGESVSLFDFSMSPTVLPSAGDRWLPTVPHQADVRDARSEIAGERRKTLTLIWRSLVGRSILISIAAHFAHETYQNEADLVALPVYALIYLFFSFSPSRLARLESGWISYSATRLWMWLHGFAPLRLLGFLEYCHGVELLRRSGSSYSFRHIELQEAVLEDAGRQGSRLNRIPPIEGLEDADRASYIGMIDESTSRHERSLSSPLDDIDALVRNRDFASALRKIDSMIDASSSGRGPYAPDLMRLRLRRFLIRADKSRAAGVRLDASLIIERHDLVADFVRAFGSDHPETLTLKSLHIY